jgi:hypothetical protein
VSDTPRTCPRCGSAELGSEYHGMLACGTLVDRRGTYHHTVTCAHFCAFRKQFDPALAAVNRERDELRAWKDSAMAVEREWNADAIATMLGGKPGESQRKVIQREVPRLLERIKRLEEAGDLMVQHFYTDEPRSEMWEKAKEDKP